MAGVVACCDTVASGGALGWSGVAQPASSPRMSAPAAHGCRGPTACNQENQTDRMWLLLLESLGALLLLVLIIWWTMFHGRPGGEPPRSDDNDQDKP